MTTSSNSIAFAQYTAIPLMGASWVERLDTRPNGSAFFHLETHHADDTCGDDGVEVKGSGPIRGYSLHLGRWLVNVDRPTVAGLETRDSPLTWNQTAWLALASPVVALAGISACLLGGTVRHIIGKHADLLPQT